MEGQWIRLNRLFSQGGRAVLAALDAGVFPGSTPGIGNLPETIDDFAGADALVVSPGMMRHCGHAFDYRGAPLAAVRLNWSAARVPNSEYRGSRTALLAEPAAAQAVGADLSVASLCVRGQDERADTHAVQTFSELVRGKRNCGLPLLGQCLPPAAEGLAPGGVAENATRGARLLSELGADAVITHFVGDEMTDVVENCPAPVLVTHTQPATEASDILQMAHRAVQAGARGFLVAGQALDAPDVPALLTALCEVVKEETDPEQAARQAGLP